LQKVAKKQSGKHFNTYLDANPLLICSFAVSWQKYLVLVSCLDVE
jgi:hypothetical protein